MADVHTLRVVFMSVNAAHKAVSLDGRREEQRSARLVLPSFTFLDRQRFVY